MPRSGRQPTKGLEPRLCEVCSTEFQPYRAGNVTCSRRCRERLPEARERARAYHSQPEVRERKNAARRVTVNPARRAVNLRNNLRRYGVTADEHAAMIDAQGNRCAICGEPPQPSGVRAAARLHVDHDHVTGAVRSLLCNRCNQGIGYFKDDPALFRAAAEYIERHRTPG